MVTKACCFKLNKVEFGLHGPLIRREVLSSWEKYIRLEASAVHLPKQPTGTIFSAFILEIFCKLSIRECWISRVEKVCQGKWKAHEINFELVYG